MTGLLLLFVSQTANRWQKNRWQKLVLLFSLLVCSASAIAQPQSAQPTPAQSVLGLSAQQVDIRLDLIGETQYQLTEVSIHDLGLASQQRLTQLPQNAVASVAGNGLSASFSFPAQRLAPVITRNIGRIWRVTSRPDQSVGFPPVSIRWDDDNQAMSASDGGRRLPVRLEPVVLDHGFDQDTGMEYWEGGVNLQIPVDQLRGDVRYSGRLLIFMESF